MSSTFSLTNVLVINFAAVIAYMLIWYAAARFRQRLDTVDTAWGLGYVLIAALSFALVPSRTSLLVALLVLVWGVRLALHIARRSHRGSEDRRYQELSAQWKGNFWVRALFSIFLFQGVLIWVVSLPVQLLAGQLRADWSWLSLVGALIWAVGFYFEAVSDYQLAQFLKDPKHPKLLTTGLWRYSRHPNYFGELVQWWGIGIISLQAVHGLFGLIGPLLLTVLIVFVSGIPPIERRRKGSKDFEAYKKRTSILIPLPPRK